MNSVGSLISKLDVSERKEALSLLVERIAQLPLMAKKVLAIYYYEGLQPAEIAVRLALTEYEVEQIHAETLRLLQAALSV
jgi:RNA polymerase sigma factor for flagellar operon FliA